MNPEPVTASTKAKSALQYDRIEVLERFLKTVYPDLADQLAMFKLDTTFEGKKGVTIRKLKFYPCRPTGGVSAPMLGGVIALSPQRPSPPQPPIAPRCGDDPTPEFEHFLDVYFDLGAEYRPVRSSSSRHPAPMSMRNCRNCARSLPVSLTPPMMKRYRPCFQNIRSLDQRTRRNFWLVCRWRRFARSQVVACGLRR